MSFKESSNSQIHGINKAPDASLKVLNNNTDKHYELVFR